MVKLQAKGSPRLCKPLKLVPVSQPNQTWQCHSLGQDRLLGRDRTPRGCRLSPNPLLLSQGLKLHLPVHTRNVCSPLGRSQSRSGAAAPLACGAVAFCSLRLWDLHPGIPQQREALGHRDEPQTPENQYLQRGTAKRRQHPCAPGPRRCEDLLPSAI